MRSPEEMLCRVPVDNRIFVSVRFLGRRVAAVVCLLAGLGSPALAQSAGSLTSGPALDGPPPPAPPATVARDAQGRVTVRAIRTVEPIVLDGRLDEGMYAEVPSISDFIQQDPVEGDPATEKTEVWVFFDDRNVYVSARCWDSQPERDVANEMRRDGSAVTENEMFMVGLDTFYDRRNGYIIAANQLGGLMDAYVTDERDFNRDWNTVWDARTARFKNGWTVEFAVPYKSLRYKATPSQVWGINFRRLVRWKNENSYLTRIPAALGRRGINKMSSAATLVGIEPPPSRRNYELKPYGIADLTTDRTAQPPTSNEVGKDVGLDVKLGLTQGLTADFSYNTDFAQVEVDEQQVNLTRFNLFFPEKREFFLEGSGTFTFGGTQGGRHDGFGPGGYNGLNPNPADVPSLFFSRQIGLVAGHLVPIVAGARVTGKSGPYSVGLLGIRTGDESRFGIQPTNFGVVRVKRDILRRSAVGVLLTDRSISPSGVGSNQLLGVDGVFSFYRNLNLNTYLAKTSTEGRKGRDLSYRAQLDYNGDRYGLQLEHLLLGDNFNPEVGFMRRSAFRRDSAFIRFSPRPATRTAVRRLTWDATYDYITDAGGRLQSRYAEVAFRPELQNGDAMALEYAGNYEFLAKPFRVEDHVTIPVGGYAFPEARFTYYFGPQRPLSGMVKIVRGHFYNGTRTELTVFRTRVSITPQLAIEPGLTLDWVDLPEGNFSTRLISARTTWTLTPRATVAALLQNTSSLHALDTNIRFQWEYQPGSFFYAVYTDSRNTLFPGFPALQGRGIVAKFTRLFRL